MLTHVQHVAVRRHLGVPFAGTAQAGRLFGWRFTIHVEDLEYRMNNMQPGEEILLTGNSLGSFRIDGIPTVGDVLTATIAGTVVTYTVQASDLAPRVNLVNPAESSPAYLIALNLAGAITQNATLTSAGYYAVGVMPADVFSPQYMNPYFAEVVITGPSSTAFTLVAARTGTTNFIVQQQGVQSPAIATLGPAGQQTTAYGYLAICDALAMKMTAADLSLSYERADVVNFRKDEIGARRALYKYYCTDLSRLMGGKAYVNKFGGGSGGGATA